MSYQKGFTIIELIIGVVILGIVTTIIVGSTSRQVSYYALQKTSESVAALLQKAHTQARNSYNGTKHSVRIESSQAILFEGTSYSASDPDNEVITYDPNVLLASTTLNGGGSIVTFEKVTGATNNYGTIIYRTNSSSTSSSTIRIGETGIIQVQ